ncbi:MAG: phenylalanine--tRNA ligase subunit beta [Acidimicrobiia bacterium]|nr:phenylalanine--tRNA ligase subunit beta [Acidimicrobiia bacterium]
MKVLLSWLREFAPFEGDPVELGDQMSDLGMAVESIDHVGGGLDGVVVARVLALRPHPDAERIQLVDVDAGDGEATQICCGAFNMAEGDLVPLATLGTTMANGMTIERRKLRGEWSNGMLCSARELAMGDDHEGIWVLPGDLALGTPLAEAIGVTPDVLYDLEINPNRPDAMSVAGVARDLAARLRLPFELPTPKPRRAGADAPWGAGRPPTVEISAPELCGRFHVRVLEDVVVGSSPAWMAHRLRCAGMRPINSVVDVSNYVMLELGQPNHTYDLDLVSGPGLRVRWANDGERITTLDDAERTLDGADGVIADAEDRAIGIAGVMGGASTEISASTQRVLLEMAWWDPMTIARSSRRLGLRSEASMRFERGCDPEVVERAAERFAELLATSGATLLAGSLDARGELPDRQPVRVRTARVNRLLGTDLDAGAVAAELTPIGFTCASAGADLDVVVPSYRYDTRTETDVVEEVARHLSYSSLPSRRPASPQTGSLTDRQRDRRRLRAVVAGLGLAEAMPSPLLSPEQLERCGAPTDAMVLTNPMAAEESVLRTSLRPGLLAAVAHNAAHRNPGVRLFEVGTVFLPTDGVLPDEPEHLGVALAGDEAPAAVAVLDVVLESFGIEGWDLHNEPTPGLHPTRSARILLPAGAGPTEAGWVGEIDPAVVEALGIDERVAWLELDLAAVLARPAGPAHYRTVSRFPSSDVDLAFVVSDDVSAMALRRTLVAAGGDLVAWVRLFDTYRGAGIEDGHRSLAYRVRLQAADRTLTDAEVAEVSAAMVAAAGSHHQARQRG